MKLKVFGGLVLKGHGKQCRTIVATTSQRKAAELCGVTLTDMRGYWCETGNADELAVALSEPGVVFQASDSMGKDFRRVTPNV